MQKFLDEFDEKDCRIVRKWRLASFGFYASIVAGLVLYAVLHWTLEVNYASVDAAAHARLAGAPSGDARTPFAP